MLYHVGFINLIMTLMNLSNQVSELSDQENPWVIFVETLTPESGLQELPPFDKDSMFIQTSLRV